MKIIAGNFKSNLNRSATGRYLADLDSRLESLDSVASRDSSDLQNRHLNNPHEVRPLGVLGVRERVVREGKGNASQVEPFSLSQGKINDLPLEKDSTDSTESKDSTKVYIFPAISSITTNNYRNLTLGAQNCHFEKSGAFTGEITLELLSEFNIKTLLIAHSERRNLFGENDEICAKKFDFFAKNDFEIFFCIGENLQVREKNDTLGFLKSQLQRIDLSYPKLVIAYEPIWAIGTGRNAEREQIKEIYDFLKTQTNAPIIYGGSVKSDNSREILNITDGILVGNASLNVDTFYQMIKE